MLLAELADAARDGYAVDEGEWHLGIRSMAVPVRTGDGRVVAALGVTTTTPGVTRSWLQDEFLPLLLRAATAMSAQLGYRQPTWPGIFSSAQQSRV